jgi:hypothetical protein
LSFALSSFLPMSPSTLIACRLLMDVGIALVGCSSTLNDRREMINGWAEGPHWVLTFDLGESINCIVL